MIDYAYDAIVLQKRDKKKITLLAQNTNSVRLLSYLCSMPKL